MKKIILVVILLSLSQQIFAANGDGPSNSDINSNSTVSGVYTAETKYCDYKITLAKESNNPSLRADIRITRVRTVYGGDWCYDEFSFGAFEGLVGSLKKIENNNVYELIVPFRGLGSFAKSTQTVRVEILENGVIQINLAVSHERNHIRFLATKQP